MAPVRVKDGDGATIMPPLVVGDDIGGRIPQGQRPRSHRDREFTAMRAKLAALLRVARGGRVAQGQFQAQCRVEVSGFEGERAQHCFLLGRVLGVDVDTDLGLQVRGHFGAAAHKCTACSLVQMAPFDASWGHLVLGKPEPFRHVLALCGGGLVLRNGLNLKQRNVRVLGGTLVGSRLPDLVHHFRKGAGQLEPLAPTLPLLAKGLTIGFTQLEGLPALAGIGAALVACIRGFELPIGASKFTFDQAKVIEEVHGHGRDLVDHRVTDAVTKVAEIVFARHVVVQAGAWSGATARVAVVQIATPLGVIVVLLHFGGPFKDDEADRVVAASASSAIVGCTQGTGETEVQGGADEPAETAVDLALRGERNRMGDEGRVREPSTRRFGKRGGQGLSVVLVEKLSMGDKGVEIKGRELLGGKRETVSAHSRSSLKQEDYEKVLL